MSRRKTNKKPIVVLLILLVLALALLGGMIWFVMTHFFVGGRAYPNDAQELDLREQTLTVDEYDRIRLQLPECVIRWNVPFQGSTYPDTAASLSVQKLSDADLKLLSYFGNLQEVNAAGCRDYEQLMALKEQYPNVKLSYSVNIGGKDYPQDAASVVCDALTDEEIALMDYLPELKYVDASGCRDSERLCALAAALPDLEVSYQVELMGQTFTEADISATFEKPDVQALQEGLAALFSMETVHLVEPDASAEALIQLTETYPDINFTWEKTILGQTFNSAETEYDLSKTPLVEPTYPAWADPLDAAETAAVTKTVEEVMAYFPNAEKVILPVREMHNETLSAFRDRMRPEYKVVWTVYITKKPVRTDQEVIHSSAYKVCFIDELSQDLIYCEDAIVVDIGHSYVKNIEWVKGMPKLKYLILTHNWIKDLTPISTCKNLIYLEIYWNDHIPDYTPLLGCTALKDLNVSGTFADPTPLAQMTWLENLWATQCRISKEQEQMLIESLPNTQLKFGLIDYSAAGWRDVPRYFEMRDIMGLGYNTW